MSGSPSWDAVIVLVYVIGMGYTIILHRERLAGYIASAYISLAVTAVIYKPIYDFLTGNKMFMNQIWVQSNASPQMVAGVTFVILAIALASFLSIMPTGRRSDNLAIWENIIYSALWVTFMISSVMSFMPDDRRLVFTISSKFMNLIWQYHTIWLIVPAFLLIFSGYRRGSNTN